MEKVIQQAATRFVRKVAVTTTVPTPAAAVDPTDDGVFALTDAIDFDQSPMQGAPPAVVFSIGKTGGTGTHVLRVYGLMRVSSLGSGGAQDGGWVPVLLYKASAVIDQTPGGTANANAFEAADKVAGAITVDAVTNAGIHQTMSAGSDGLSHIRLDCRGCPYLVFVGADDDMFVLAKPST